MKRELLLLLLLCVLSYTTFAQNTQKLIVGTWKVDIEVFQQKATQQMKEELARKLETATTEEEKKQIEREVAQAKPFIESLVAMMKNVRITFHTNGTLETRAAKNVMGNAEDIEIKKGTWKIENDGKSISTVIEEEPQNTQKIISISKKKIILENPEAPENSVMKQMTFIKVTE